MNLGRRIDRLERMRARGTCRACAALRNQAVFLDNDMKPIGPEDTTSCPACGQPVTGRKVYIGLDPQKI